MDLVQKLSELCMAMQANLIETQKRIQNGTLTPSMGLLLLAQWERGRDVCNRGVRLGKKHFKYPRHGARWTEEERTHLRRLFRSTRHLEIPKALEAMSKDLRRSPKSVEQELNNILTSLWNEGHSVSEVALQMGVSEDRAIVFVKNQHALHSTPLARI